MAWLFAPLLLSGLFGLAGPPLARRMSPHLATWLLSIGGAVAAAASSASIALCAFVFVAQDPVLVAHGHWSQQFLRGHTRYADPLGALACALVILFSARFVRVTARQAAALRKAFHLAAAFPAASELAVVDSPEPQAFAVPGRPGRIVATSGMLRSLDAEQRRGLLAHERAHLDHRHHLHQAAAQLTAAINPLLWRVPAAVELSCERWADEAATRVCRRSTVAAALARAATARPPRTPATVLAAAGADVLTRLAALNAPPPRPASWRLAALLSLLLATTAAVAIAMHDVERLFELAQNAYRAGHH